MDKELNELEIRVSRLESLNNDTHTEIENLRFNIIESENKNIGSITIAYSGNFRGWTELQLGGFFKASNWAVNFNIVDSSGNPTICDWIQLTNCNYTITHTRTSQATVVEKSGFSFTTLKQNGWKDITFDIQVKQRHNS